MAAKKKPKKSKKEVQKIDENVPNLQYLTADEALCLTAILLYPTDAKAVESLGWSRGKFYTKKKRVVPLKEAFAKEALGDTMFALSLAGRHAVAAYIEMLTEKNGDRRKEVADEVMDRLGIINQDSEETPAPQVAVQTIIEADRKKYTDD